MKAWHLINNLGLAFTSRKSHLITAEIQSAGTHRLIITESKLALYNYHVLHDNYHVLHDNYHILHDNYHTPM